MAAKLGIVEEEADESLYWMELIVEDGIKSESAMASLIQETDEILAMVVASLNTIKQSLGTGRKTKHGN